MTALADRIEALEAIPWIDPEIAPRITTKEKPEVAPTGGPPHRLTIYVPYHEPWTVVNLGAEHEDRDYGNGIFMQTREHIQWRTATTAYCMGEKSTHFQMDDLPGDSFGHSLVTRGRAYHHADAQHLLTSRLGDMVVRTKQGPTAVLQSDAGIAEVNAGRQVRVNAARDIWITTESGYSPVTTTYDTPWDHESRSMGVKGFAVGVRRVVNMLRSGGAALKALGGVVGQCVGRKKGWKSGAATALVKAAAETAKAIVAGDSLPDADQSIKASACRGVGIFGNRNASLYGRLSSGVGSMGMTLLGGTTADVKGYATAAVSGGRRASLVSNTEGTTVASFFHSVIVDAGTYASFVADQSVMVTSLKGWVTVRGKDAVLYGGKRAYIGRGDCLGIVVGEERLEVGKVTSPKKFGAAAVNRKHGIFIDDEVATMRSDWAYGVTCTKDGAALNHKKVRINLHDGGISVKAKNIDVDA